MVFKKIFSRDYRTSQSDLAVPACIVYNDFYTQHRRGLCESRSDGHFQFTTAKRISSFDVPLGSTKASRQTDADALYDRRSYRLSRAVSE